VAALGGPYYFTQRLPGRHNCESYCIPPNSRSRAGQRWCGLGLYHLVEVCFPPVASSARYRAIIGSAARSSVPVRESWLQLSSVLSRRRSSTNTSVPTVPSSSCARDSMTGSWPT
jgi:hypothetical protein